MSPLLPVIAALIASAPSEHPKLQAGLELYRSGDLKGSLALLLEALDSGTAKQRATARLYVGLIQHRTGNARDASASFKYALELWPEIRPPRSTPKTTLRAFEEVREKLAPEEPSQRTKKKERRRSTVRERGPEVLEPIDGASASPGRDWTVEPPEEAADRLSLAEPAPEPEDESFPTLGWVAGSAGAAAAIAGVTLAIVAGVTGKRALDAKDKESGAELHRAAGTQNKAAFASFGAAGVLFGLAALSVTF